MAGKKTDLTGPQMLSNIGRGDFVVLKRHLNKKGEISKKARLGNVRKRGKDGHEVLWTNKSDRKQSTSRKAHHPDTLHKIDGKTVKAVAQFLHKHIADKSSSAAAPIPVVVPPETG